MWYIRLCLLLWMRLSRGSIFGRASHCLRSKRTARVCEVYRIDYDKQAYCRIAMTLSIDFNTYAR